jgi:hypothetical protein
MPYQPIDLGRVMQTAESIKGMRRQSSMDALQEKYLNTQIAGAQQTQGIQAQDAKQKSDIANAHSAYFKSKAVLSSDDPGTAARHVAPDMVAGWEQTHGQGSWDTLSKEQVKQVAEMGRQKAISVIGPQEPETIGDLKKPEAGIWQKDAAGNLKQVTAPQKPEASSFSPVNMADGTVGRFNSRTGLLESTGQKGGTRTGGIQPMSDDQLQSRAKMIANYEMPAPSSYEMSRNPSAAALMEQVSSLNPGYSANEYGARSKAFKDFSTGKQGQQVKSFNVAISHLDSLEKAADALDNNDTPLLNKISNAWARETGKQAPTNFDGMKKVVTDEIVKAIVGAGGGVADREEASKTLSAASSPAQLIGMMGKYRELMAGQLNGLQQQYEQSTGRNDFTRWLSPASQTYLSQHSQMADAPQSSPQPGQQPAGPPALQPGQTYRHASGATIQILP